MFRVLEQTMRTDTGRRRSGNEDSAYVRVPLFMIADGMGGAQAGEVASKIALEHFASGLPDGPQSADARLAQLISAANAEVFERASSDDNLAGMGTTCTAAFLTDDELAIAHVGDSRMYRVRGGELEQLTDDHSLVGELVRRGQLTEQEAEDHPQRSIITRALGPEAEVEVDHFSVPVRDGDLFLICSDGLTDMLPDAELAALFAQPAESIDELARRLVAAANEAGGKDNITVICFRVQEVTLGMGADEPVTESHAVLRAEPDRPAEQVPAAAQPEPRRGGPTRAKAAALAATLILAVCALLISAGWIASRSVSFLGVNDEGFVTLYKGLPYDLPLLPLYQEQYVSGLPASEVGTQNQDLLTDHELRTQDDAVDLVRQLEQGTVDDQS